jgi:hypothetical protein
MLKMLGEMVAQTTQPQLEQNFVAAGAVVRRGRSVWVRRVVTVGTQALVPVLVVAAAASMEALYLLAKTHLAQLLVARGGMVQGGLAAAQGAHLQQTPLLVLRVQALAAVAVLQVQQVVGTTEQRGLPQQYGRIA